MFIDNICDITEKDILSDLLFREIYEIDDEYEKARIIISVEERAGILHKKTEFVKLLRAYTKQRKIDDQKKLPAEVEEHRPGLTEFKGGDYQDYKCGYWIANENGVCVPTQFGENEACSHPIMPIQILTNAETGFYKVKLAFKLKRKWREIIVDKEVISSASKIVSLSKLGIRVTSENAKTLVRYLSDMEAMNEEYITEQISTSKLGWISGEFMPYGENIVFDNEQSLKTVFDAVKENGSREKWYETTAEIRSAGKFEAKIYLVASFASILIELVNGLPFVLNLYGETGKGKTVALMLAASVWANPAEGQYLSDAKATTTALESRLNFLNNLPMMLDDMAQIKDQYKDGFANLIYLWCAGKGKDRSNRNLGINPSTTWRNVILTNAERSLVDELSQGGAITRIIDVELDSGYLFEDGNKIVEVLKNNYGFAGREFVDVIRKIGSEKVVEIQKSFYAKIVKKSLEIGCEKEEKQILPMSIILTADYLIEKFLFRDGCILPFSKCVNILKGKNEISENIRAYQFIIDEVQMNGSRFARSADDFTANECWGMIDKQSNIAIINSNAFKKIAERGNFSEKGFLSWAVKNEKIEVGSDGRTKKNKRIGQSTARCVFLKLDNEFVETEDGFVKMEDVQEELPWEKEE